MKTTKRILLIEDDIDDQLFFRWAIEAIDPKAECVIAKNGTDAMQKLIAMKMPPSWIFLDLNMPLMNGFECLRKIREKKLDSDIPVIILSTSGNMKDIAKAKEHGAAGYLKKPNNTNSLVKALEEIFSIDFNKTENYFVLY
ncbi:response regulator [Aquiflexum sp.]|uniref:response regulator n=1 Tax=Aquiflexum sp. TaxID=1872584 RepID=UPI003592E99D